LLIALVALCVSLASSSGTFAKNDEAKFASEEIEGETTGTVVVDPPVIGGNNEVLFNMHGCPAGYDVVNPNYYAAAADCNEPIAPVTFHLYDDLGEHIGTTDWLYSWTGVTRARSTSSRRSPRTRSCPSPSATSTTRRGSRRRSPAADSPKSSGTARCSTATGS
jgi:hypothetical protein